jgi:rod shape-determining protein MreB
VACGDDAKAMLDREPGDISAISVLTEGIINNQEAAVALFRHGLSRVAGRLFVRPRVIVARRPYDPGKRAVQEAAVAGGAREVYLIEIGMATAIGMNLDVQAPELKAVLSVSNDWFAFTVISASNVLTGTNGAIGIKAFVEDIQNHFVLTHQVRPDSAALETQLMSGGIDSAPAAVAKGWGASAGENGSGRPVDCSVSPEEISIGLMPSLVRMTERIKNAIRALPKEQQDQLNRTTIYAAGAAMAIPGLPQVVADQLGQSLTPFSSRVHPSIEGCSVVLKELKFLKKVKPAKK